MPERTPARVALSVGLMWGQGVPHLCVPAACSGTLLHRVLSNPHDTATAYAGLTAKDIDILVVNCSLFNPTPSLSAMIVNHFKMRSDLISYNLAGMGCSAGVIAIGLAERLLRSEPGKYALVVSTENITQARPSATA